MRPPLRISSIDREHLQELYDEAGIPRDELPYSEAFDRLCAGFQDRTFKNAHPEQVYAAVAKHVRSSTVSSRPPPDTTLTEQQLKQLKILAARHATGGKLLPYGEEINAARAEFNAASGLDLNERDFWIALQHAQGARRRPPPPPSRGRRSAAAAAGATGDTSDTADTSPAADEAE